MAKHNEYTKQGIALRQYVFETIGAQLFAERRRRGHTLAKPTSPKNSRIKPNAASANPAGQSLPCCSNIIKKATLHYLHRYKTGITPSALLPEILRNNRGCFPRAIALLAERLACKGN